jgi:hypothetical protein
MRNTDDAGSTEFPTPSAFSKAVILPLMVIFLATLAAQLISLGFGRSDQEQQFLTIVIPSLVYLSAVTLPLAWLGLWLGSHVGLGAPLLSDLIANKPGSVHKLVHDAGLAVVLGLLLGIALLLLRSITAPYLPPELPAFGHRGIIGGLAVSLGAAVGEEVWFRLGMMTLLIWSAVKITGRIKPSGTQVWFAILLTSILFGAAHLPQLLSYGAGSSFAIAGTVAGNTLVGILYGWCYWKQSLVAAITAHFSVDIVLHVIPAFFG